MPRHVRFTVCTHNLWKHERWPRRAGALQRFVEGHRPDILCLQEIHPGTREILDRTLPGHDRIEDPFPGYLYEGNIYWTRDLFECVAYGREDVGIEEEQRGLFWARLQLRSDLGGGHDRQILVATAHFTWPEHPKELATGVNLRVGQARRTADRLQQLAGPEDPLLFMGDLNETLHPVRILGEIGLVNCFEGLGRVAPPTFPTVPTGAGSPKARASKTIDWLLYRGPLAPMACDVVDLFVDDVAPSDHRPVIATFRLC